MPEAICRGDQTLSVSHSHAVYLTQREVKKGEESSHSADKPLLNLPSCSFKKHTHTLSGRQRWAALCIRTAARQDVIRLQNSQLAILLTVYTAYRARRFRKEIKRNIRKVMKGRWNKIDRLSISVCREEQKKESNRSRRKKREFFDWYLTEVWPVLCIEVSRWWLQLPTVREGKSKSV